MPKRSAWKSYWAVAVISLRNTRQYTIDFLTYFIYFPVQLIAIYFVYAVIYNQAWILDGTTIIGGFTLVQLISYLFITIIFQRILPHFALGIEVERDIDQGPLIGYLTKPIDYTGFRFFRELPRSLLFFSFGIITYIIGIPLISLPLPAFHNILLFIPFFLIAYIVSFFLFFTTSLMTFWIGHHWWLRSFISLFMMIAGGGLIPLTFFPPTIQLLFSLMPFQYCYYMPAVILQGFYSPNQLINILLLGIFWLFLLYLAGRLVWRLGRRHYEGAGG